MPTCAIIVSEQDPAGLNIKEQLLQLYKFKETGIFDARPVYTYNDIQLYTIERESIHAENIDKEIKADYFIFATKHRAESMQSSLCVHVPGNWDKAEAGGKPKTLCTAMPDHMKTAFKKLNEFNAVNFEVTMECTHHGPYLEKPVMFIEIGSSEHQWKNKDAGIIIAETIIDTIENPQQCKKAILLGGMHYNQSANKIMLDTEIAIGHICPKYALEFLDEKLLKEAIEKTSAELILLDWKGLGQYKEKVKELLKDVKLEIKKTKEL